MKFDHEITGQIRGEYEFTSFLSSVNYFKKKRPFKLLIFSSGGCGETALAIADLIKAKGLNIHAYCFGKVESAALVVLEACKKKFAAPHCLFMSHEARAGDGGWLETMRHRKKLDHYNNYMISVLPFRIEKKCTYYTAEEAKELGMIDQIL